MVGVPSVESVEGDIQLSEVGGSEGEEGGGVERAGGEADHRCEESVGGLTLGEESGAGTCKAELGGVELRRLWAGDVEGDPEDLDGAGCVDVDGGRDQLGP